MSSNVGRVPNTGAQAKAEEAFLLEQIGKRAPSPTQAVKVCQILNLATRENIRRVREIAKNKIASEAENKNPEEKMEVREKQKLFKRIERLAKKIFGKRFDNIMVWARGIDCYARPSEAVEDISIRVVNTASLDSVDLVASGEYHDINICVCKPTYLAISKKFGNRYEELTGKRAFVLKEY